MQMFIFVIASIINWRWKFGIDLEARPFLSYKRRMENDLDGAVALSQVARRDKAVDVWPY